MVEAVIPYQTIEVAGLKVEVPCDDGPVRVKSANPAWLWRSMRAILTESGFSPVGLDEVLPPIADEELRILADVCDEQIARPDGGSGPRYQFEGTMGDEADLLRLQMMMAAAIAIADRGPVT